MDNVISTVPPYARFLTQMVQPPLSVSYKSGIILTKPGYYTIPTLEECDKFYNPFDDTCVVADSFTVGRIDHGSIVWKGPLNVKGLDLDEIVHINHRQVIVYPDDDRKPALGQGLNRPAEITLVQVWPVDKSPQCLIRFSKILNDFTIKMGAKFKDYCPKTGSWVFDIEHFSKYGLDSDDVENDGEPAKDDDKSNPKAKASKLDVMKTGPKDPNSIHNVTTDIVAMDDCGLAVNMEHDHILEQKTKIDDEYSLMRSALFVDDDVETVSKKCKNLSFTQSQVSVHQVVSSSLFPAKFNNSIPRKRRLQFDPKPSNLKANVYSFNYAKFPKARFSNGSNRFCWIIGTEVLVFEFDTLKLDEPESIEKLKHHLAHNSSIEKAEDQKIAPLIRTNSYSLNAKVDSNINLLIEALFGELCEKMDYARHQERLRRVLKWLYTYNQTLSVPERSYDRIIHFLTTNELEFAVTECINFKLARLSYLISFGPYVNKELIKAQLKLWKKTEIDSTIKLELLKIYVILSGLSCWTTSDGRLIEPLTGLHWTQQLSLLLLYKTREDDMIGTNLVKASIEELTYKPNTVEYHLLAQHQPWVTLASSPNYLDSWFLQEALVSYNVIRGDMVTNKCDSINLFMASQTCDMRWALFFALHVTNDFLRTYWVRELLMQNADLLNQELELYFVEEYLLNPIFLFEAKFYLAKTNHDNKAMALNLIACRKFKQAHDVLMDKIFPELVINEDYQEIELLIEKLSPHRHEIPNWNTSGVGIYDTFLQLLRFGQSPSDLDHYRKLIDNFNVYQMQCPTNRHALCQSQMARVANIISAELTKGLFPYNTTVPYDFSLSELRSNAYKLYELKADP